MLEQLSKNWWVLLIQGILAMLFGIAAWLWPGLTAVVLAIVFGAYVLVDGVTAIMGAVRGGAGTSRGWLAFVGIVSVLAGLIALFWPGVSAIAMVLVIGFWAIVKGVGLVAAAVQLRKEIDNEWLLIITGALTILFGAVVLIWPGEGLLAMMWLIGIFAIAVGIAEIVAAFRIRGLGKEGPQATGGEYGTGGAAPAPS